MHNSIMKNRVNVFFLFDSIKNNGVKYIFHFSLFIFHSTSFNLLQYCNDVFPHHLNRRDEETLVR